MSQTLTDSKMNPTTIRTLGGVLAFLGMILVGSMVAIMIWINNLMNNASSTTKWNASPEQKNIIFLVLGLVMAFGISTLVTGGWQILTGKRNIKLIWIILGFWGVLMIAAWAVQIYF